MTNEEIRTELEPLRQESKGKFTKFMIAGGGCLLLSGLSFLLAAVEIEGLEGLAVLAQFLNMIGFIAAIVCFAIATNVASKFKKEVFGRIKTRIYDKYFPVRKEVEDRGMTIEEILYPGFFKKPDRFTTSDFMSSSWNGLSFRQSKYDLKERHVHSSKNGTYVTYDTYAKGTMYFFDFEKELNAVVKVIEKGGPSTADPKLQKFETEYMEFNKKFQIKASNQQAVFYLLTPQIQEKIMALEPMFKGQFYMAFIGSDLWIAVNDNNESISLSLFKDLDDKTFERLDFLCAAPKVFIDNLGLSKDKFKEIEL